MQRTVQSESQRQHVACRARSSRLPGQSCRNITRPVNNHRWPLTQGMSRWSAAAPVLRGRRADQLRQGPGAHLAGRRVVANSQDPNSADAVCIGEGLFDLIADQKGQPRDKVASWSAYAGGAPCNVATCLARLGVRAAFITALGSDERGDELAELLESRGVVMTGVQRLKEPTREVYVVRDEQGDREFAGFGLPSESYSDCFLDAHYLPAGLIRNAKVLVTGTLGLAYPGSRNAIEKAVEIAKSAGTLVMVDVNWRPVFWKDSDAARQVIHDYLQSADIIKLSDADLEWLYGIDIDVALRDPCCLVEKLPKAVAILATAGDEGAAYCFRSDGKTTSDFVEVFKVDSVDTTGAGDAFTAGFLQQMLEAGGPQALAKDPKRLRQAVVFASACGALTTTRAGAIGAQPTREECLALASKAPVK